MPPSRQNLRHLATTPSWTHFSTRSRRYSNTLGTLRAARAKHMFLTGLDIRRSVGRTGVCWDNAMAESFFSVIKNEWLHRFVFTTRAKAKSQVIRYIEGFYNRRRLHSALGYRPPLEVLDEALSAQTAA